MKKQAKPKRKPRRVELVTGYMEPPQTRMGQQTTSVWMVINFRNEAYATEGIARLMYLCGHTRIRLVAEVL